MTRIECDRCGTLSDGARPSEWTGHKQFTLIDGRIFVEYHLCGECGEDFSRFIRTGAVEKSQPPQAEKQSEAKP
jgi:hypothetical protein